MVESFQSAAAPPAGEGREADALLGLLKAEEATLAGVARTLEDEHAALLDGDAAAIEQAAAAKRSALGEHGEQQRRRLSWMAERQLAPDTRLGDLVARTGGASGGDLDAAAASLAALARQCDVANRRNGALILRLQERTRRALGVLRGSDAATDVYSLSGAQEHGSDRRSLGKA